MRATTQYSEGRIFHIGVRIRLGLHRLLRGGHGALRLRFIQRHGGHGLCLALLALRLLHSATTTAHSLRAAQNNAKQSRLD